MVIFGQKWTNMRVQFMTDRAIVHQTLLMVYHYVFELIKKSNIFIKTEGILVDA